MPSNRSSSRHSHSSRSSSKSHLPRGSRPDRIEARKRRYVRIYGTVHVERSLIRKIALTMMVFLGIGAALIWTLHRNKQEVQELKYRIEEAEIDFPDKVSETTRPIETESLENRFFERDFSRLAERLRDYFSYYSHFDIESYSFQGAQTSGNGQFVFELYGRAGGLSRQTLKKDGHELMAGVSRVGYWQRFNDKAFPIEKTGIDALSPYVLKLQATYFGLLWQAEEEGIEAFELGVPDTYDVGEHSCWVIQNNGLISVPVYHYIDQANGLERMRSAEVLIDEKLYLIEVEYAYEQSSLPTGRTMPHRKDGTKIVGIRVRIDGEEIAEAKVESMRLNLGMPDWFFEPNS